MTKIDVLTELREQQRVRPRSYSSDLAQRAADEIERLRKWNADMVAKAASGGTLDGYREMGARIAALDAENAKLKRALVYISDCSLTLTNAEDTARAALDGGGDD